MSMVDAHLRLDDGIDGGAQLQQILPGLGTLVGQVGHAELMLSTPCDGWNTRDLLNHVIGGAEMFADAFAGAPLRDISGRLPDVVGDDPADAFGRAAERFGAGTKHPGAMQRVLALPFGSMTGETFLRFAAFDLLVHSWDLATTLDVPLEVDDDLVAEVDRFAHVVLDPWQRDHVNFQDATTGQPQATPMARLVAFTGRTP